MAPRSDEPRLPGAVPELELDLHRPAAPVARPAKKAVSDPPLELAVDPISLVRERRGSGGFVVAAAPLTPATLQAAPPAVAEAPTGDLDFDAKLLANYGDPPARWYGLLGYAWRVLRRRRELGLALVGRREEAARAAAVVESALISFAERCRPIAEKSPVYGPLLERLRQVEEGLRSRDQLLATEQDAQQARLVQLDARLATLEAELVQSRAEETTLGARLLDAQEELAREEARLKRAQSELRTTEGRAGGTIGEGS